MKQQYESNKLELVKTCANQHETNKARHDADILLDQIKKEMEKKSGQMEDKDNEILQLKESMEQLAHRLEKEE
jgi:hypothetical protein